MKHVQSVTVITLLFALNVFSHAAPPAAPAPATPPPAAVAPVMPVAPSPLTAPAVMPVIPVGSTALTIDQAVALALKQNPALREATARAQEAAAGVQRAKAPEQPQVRATGAYDTANFVPSFQLAPPPAPPFPLGLKTTWLADLNAEQVIFSNGRLQALVRQATNNARAVQVSNERTQQQVVYQTERAFYMLVAAQRERAVAAQAVVTAEEHLRVADASFAAATVAHFDVLRAQVQVEEARQQLIGAESDITIARAGLLQAMGQQDGNFTAIEPPTTSLPVPPPLANLLGRAHLQRPELRALGYQLTAAEAAIVAAKGEQGPTVSVSLDYQGVKPGSPFLYSRWLFGAMVSMPIFDGGAIKADQQLATAQQAQLVASRDTALDEVDTEVRQAYARLTSSAEQVTVAQTRVDEATEALRIANVRYAAGVGTAVEVADAESSFTSAQQGLTQAITQWGIATAELRYATGAPVASAPLVGAPR